MLAATAIVVLAFLAPVHAVTCINGPVIRECV